MEKQWECFDYLVNEPITIENGLVFVYYPSSLKRYYYGVIVNTHAKTAPADQLLHLHFFDYSTLKIKAKPDLSKALLLFPPVLIRYTEEANAKWDFEKSAWPDGVFKIVGTVDLHSLDSIQRAMFVDMSGWLYNDIGEAVGYDQIACPDAYHFLGQFSQSGKVELEDLICHALSLPLDRNYHFGAPPLWYIDSFKDKLNELLERQQKAFVLCSGAGIPLQTIYTAADITLTVNQSETDWVRYIRQCGSEHYAAIQYHIEPVTGEHPIIFINKAAIAEPYKDNPHQKRMFQAFVLMFAEGIQDFAEYQHKENSIAIGGIRITLHQLLIHESDSKFMDYKLAGSMLLRKYFPK